MARLIRKHYMLALFGLAAGLGMAAAGAPARAQATTPGATPSAQNEAAGATTGLGSSHRFKTAASATAHCPGDTLVWSSGPGTTYVLAGAPGYGKASGFYACKAEADDAGFTAAKN